MERESLKLVDRGNALRRLCPQGDCGACGVDGVEVGSVEVGSAEMTFDPGRMNAGEIAAAIDRIGLTAHIERS